MPVVGGNGEQVNFASRYKFSVKSTAGIYLKHKEILHH